LIKKAKESKEAGAMLFIVLIMGCMVADCWGTNTSLEGLETLFEGVMK
jgi:hypothetical protein